MVDPKLGSDAHNNLHYDVIAELLIINKPAVIPRMSLTLHFRANQVSRSQSPYNPCAHSHKSPQTSRKGVDGCSHRISCKLKTFAAV